MNAKNAALLLAALVLSVTVMDSLGQRGGGRGGGGRGGGGGARMSAARAGGGRSLPANYGSVHSAPAARASVPPRTYVPTSPPRTHVPPSPVRRDPALDAHRGEARSIETRRGGEVNVGVTQGGNLVARGETAGGRDYGAARGQGGDRIVVGQTANGDVAVRAKGDFDGVRVDLPDDCETVVVGGYNYYRRGYDYYWPYYYGGSMYYQEIYAPPGATVPELPPDAGSVSVEDEEYSLYEGVYYSKQGDEYVVVDPPIDLEPSAPVPGLDAGTLLNQMGAYLASLSNFVFELTETAVSPRRGGETTTTQRRIYVSRPNRISAAALEGDDKRRFWYDGKSVSLYDHSKKTYATLEAAETMPETLDMLRDDYGMNIPLSDLLRPDVAESLLAAVESATYVLDEPVGGRPCHKLTLMTAEVHAQLWIEADEKAPRPRKVDLLYYTQPGQPRYQALINKCEPVEDLDETLFVFEPPEGAMKVEVVPLAGEEPGS